MSWVQVLYYKVTLLLGINRVTTTCGLWFCRCILPNQTNHDQRESQLHGYKGELVQLLSTS